MTAPARLALSLLLALAAACRRAPEPGRLPRLVVLGIDGMDPQLLGQYMREGRTPHLRALARRGAFVPLGTTMPPQSPVAWSSFLTGLRPEQHGIFDFVHRDPATMNPYLSTSRVEEPEHLLELGDLAVPLGGTEVELLRRGTAFWERLAAHGIPASVIQIPANFPPVGDERGRSTSGMGTPDLMGTYGTFQLFTDDPQLLARPAPGGGLVHRLQRRGRHRLAGALRGPDGPAATPLTVPLELVRDAGRSLALVRIGDEERLLQAGEWSGWVPLRFDPGPLVPAVSGMVRLFLRTVHPHATLYVSPVNLDPAAPALPIAAPEAWLDELVAGAGRFYTQGMPEDTKALGSGALSDDEFLAQVDLVFQERLRLLRTALASYEGGLFFFYFSTVDMVSHVFYRAIEADAAPADARHAGVIPEVYARIDAAVGEVLDKVGRDALVLVMSDHGFAPYRHKVNLNTWLAQHGYLVVRERPAAGGALAHIDWERTQAYALGLNQLFLNLQGREIGGTVPVAQKEVLLQRIAEELQSFRDPATGAQVVSAVYRPDGSAFADRAPDLIVGYNRGYRSSDESALGAVAEQVIEPNRDKWSGDHCMDPRHVPGVLVASRPIARRPVTLEDLTPTILHYFGLPVAPELAGASFLSPGR